MQRALLKTITRVFAALFGLLLAFFSAGWFALTLGPENPIPWVVFNVWANMITVGMAVQQIVGYVPSEGRSLASATLVVGSSAMLWALVFTMLLSGAAWCLMGMKKLREVSSFRRGSPFTFLLIDGAWRIRSVLFVTLQCEGPECP